MESDWKGDEGKREYIQRIIRNRGRQVDLHHYLMKHPDELLKGVLIAGSVGSGKTQRSISIVKSALDIGYGVVVFDPSNDYQCLLHEYEDGVVIDFSEFYQNPLLPSDISIRRNLVEMVATVLRGFHTEVQVEYC